MSLTLNQIRDYTKCPRSHYLNAHQHLERIKQPVWWAVNRALRLGMQDLLADSVSGEYGYSHAIITALHTIERAAARGFDLQNVTPTELVDTVEEAKALVEILLRLAHKLWLPELLSKWEIASVSPTFEREGIQGHPLAVLTPRAKQQAPEAILKAMGGTHSAILEVGSVSRWDETTEKRAQSARHDLNLIALGQATYPDLWHALRLTFERNDALTRPWKSNKSGVYAVEYQQKNYTGHTKPLTKDFKRVQIWREMSLEKWVEQIAPAVSRESGIGNREKQTPNPLLPTPDSLLPAPWARKRLITQERVYMPWDVESALWQLAHVQDEMTSFNGNKDGMTWDGPGGDHDRNYKYPQNDLNCVGFTVCPYFDACHTMPGLQTAELVESGLYQISEPREEQTNV